MEPSVSKMQIITVKTLVAVCALSVVAGVARGNLVTNPSFETPVVPVAGFTNFFTGSTLITGWTVVGPEVSIVNGSFVSLGELFPAKDGVQWLDLTGDVSNAVEGVEQTVTTIPGTTYTLSFYVGNVFQPGGAYGTTSTVNVRLGGIGGTLLGSFTNSSTTPGTQIWQPFSTSFTAAGSSTTLDFINGDSVFDNTNGLDLVDLEVGGSGSVPEPASIGLVGSALALIAFRMRRKHT
jgi:hypothetical protein